MRKKSADQVSLTDLKVKRDEHLVQAEHHSSEALKIDLLIASLESYLTGKVTTTHLSERKSSGGRASKNKPNPYYGQSIGEAAFTVLGAQPTKRGLSPREIDVLLSAANYPIAHSKPSHAIHNALRKRANNRGDVLLVAIGKWGLEKWYSKVELKEFREKNLDGRGGRNREDHIERTKVGLETARARGVVLGAKPKIDDAMKLRIQRMVALKGREKMTLKEIADAEGIAVSSIFTVFRGGRKGIMAWKPERAAERQSDLLSSVAGSA